MADNHSFVLALITENGNLADSLNAACRFVALCPRSRPVAPVQPVLEFVLDAGMTIPAMIIPRVWNKNNDNTEHAVGYINSSVVVRKIAAPQGEWDVTVQSITSDMYPH